MDPGAEIIESLRRRASLATVGGFRPPADPLTSWLGQACALGRHESWPTCDGVPMIGVCQIVVGELPYIPPALSDVALITLFMRAADGRPDPAGIDDGCWEIRTYADLAAVVAVGAECQSAVAPFPVRWTEITSDLPDWDDAIQVLSAEQLAEIEDDFHDVITGPVSGFKVGGWPTLIQSEIFWGVGNPAAPAYVLQVDSDEKTGITWGDRGVLHLGRGVADPSAWALAWQCM